MSADDHLSPQQFYYHGSPADIEIGGHVEPTHPARWDHEEQRGHVFLTTDQNSARGWAYRGMRDDGERSREPYIYKVQPTGPVERDPVQPSNKHTDYRSQHPLRVVDRVRAGDEFKD